MTREFFMSILRHLLTTGAGALAGHGYLQNTDTEQFVGAGLLVFGLAWSWWEKRQAARAVQTSGPAPTPPPA